MAPSTFSSSSDSVAARVRRNPRTASREARTRLSALFAERSVSPSPAPARTSRVTAAPCRYMLRSMRRQAQA